MTTKEKREAYPMTFARWWLSGPKPHDHYLLAEMAWNAAIESTKRESNQAQEAVQPDWYQCPTTEAWFEHPADCNLLEGFIDPLKVGFEYEIDVCWSGKQKFRVVKVEDDKSDDVEVELIESSRELFTAPPNQQAQEPFGRYLSHEKARGQFSHNPPEGKISLGEEKPPIGTGWIPLYTAPPNQREVEADAFDLLEQLATALDKAFISSWQSTAAWQKELNAALAYIQKKREG